MKYIKTFEDRDDFVIKFKIGDYIMYNTTTLLKTTGKIVDIDYTKRFPYILYVPGISDYNPTISAREIVRHLTPEEIDQFEIEENLKKYNL